MGCKCDSKPEELEILQNLENKSNEGFHVINKESKIGNSFSCHKNSDISNYLLKNNETFQTLSDKYGTIYLEENTSKKNTIEIIEKEDESEESYNEDIIDKSLPSDEFSKYIFSQINLLRANPSSFIDLIRNSESNIQIDKKNRLIYKTKLKVALNKGIKAFEEAKLILSNTKPMDKLIYKYDMNLKLQKKEINIKNHEYLKNQVAKKNSNGVKIKAYWKEIIYEPETCFVLMIVDDNGKKAGFKRRSILNPEYKYIGICSKMVNDKFICYITLN